MDDSPSFYKNLVPIHQFQDFLHDEHYAELPADWWVITTDVAASTQAIQAGKYKEVNISGALSIMALGNFLGGISFPFIFGGDGTTMAIPPCDQNTLHCLLWDIKQKIREWFDFELRIMFLSAAQIKNKKLELRIAKLQISNRYQQAIFKGNGWDWLEESLKKDTQFSLQMPLKLVDISADLSGFSCRWQDIKSSKGEVLSLIIKFNHSSQQGSSIESSYNNLIAQLHKFYGEIKDYHPLDKNYMNTHRQTQLWKYEVWATWSKKISPFFTWLNVCLVHFQAWSVSICLKYKIPLPYQLWRLDKIHEQEIASSDVIKFDGTLKMVISGTKEARIGFIQYLTEQENKGILNFGISVSNSAIMTCLIKAKQGEEVHFVDGSQGGYALAAVQLKAKIVQLKKQAEQLGPVA